MAEQAVQGIPRDLNPSDIMLKVSELLNLYFLILGIKEPELGEMIICIGKNINFLPEFGSPL
jgi:hypothetical protein